MKRTLEFFGALGVLMAFSWQFATEVTAQGTAFTYQGQLNDGGAVANGLYDFQFGVYSDALGTTQIGGSVATNGVTVNHGLFTVGLNFGAGIFTGSNYWLQVQVRTNGAGTYSTLKPLQGVTPTPYATFAETSGNLSGELPVTQLSGGTAAINISGNAATATTAANVTGQIADSQLSANIARLNTQNAFSGSNIFAGVTIATNGNNLISGTFSGNGGGLTNVSAQISSSSTNPIPVLSVNVATNPIPVYDVDNPARFAIAQQLTCGFGSSTASSSAAFAVPSGYRLVIETVGAYLQGSWSSTTTYQVFIYTTVANQIAGSNSSLYFSFLVPTGNPGGLSSGGITQPVKLYADPGTQVTATCYSSAGTSATIQIQISGYLVRVTPL